MKVIALISGGKDSLYNLHFCTAHNHEIIALANLYPANNTLETDSYMYQSVGQTGVNIQNIARALDVPLFRREIRGRPENKEMRYKETEEDEVEDLFQLIKDIKDQFPEAKGIASGAIYSDYQRDRVENICKRLQMESLAYLWHLDQKELLSSMVRHNINAVLIKVAAIELDKSHLGKSLAEMKDHLFYLNKRHDVHPCGEGGEYETFTLDCPLYKYRLEITEKKIHSTDEAFAPVAFMEFDTKLVLKEKWGMSSEMRAELLRSHQPNTPFGQLKRRYTVR